MVGHQCVTANHVVSDKCPDQSRALFGQDKSASQTSSRDQGRFEDLLLPSFSKTVRENCSQEARDTSPGQLDQGAGDFRAVGTQRRRTCNSVAPVTNRGRARDTWRNKGATRAGCEGFPQSHGRVWRRILLDCKRGPSAAETTRGTDAPSGSITGATLQTARTNRATVGTSETSTTKRR